MNNLLRLSATRQAQLIRERRLSSLELIDAHLERIAQINPQINAAIEVFSTQARAAARQADASPNPAAPLHGVPFSVKDSLEIAGFPCTAGTLGRRHTPPATRDATLVNRLREAGGIPIARTNLPDLLWSFESDNLLYGATRNPYDLSRTSGGSSGGEAALIAACGSPLGLGSDAAGSVRLPAAFCGIAGIKPTTGRLPRTGHYPSDGGWISHIWQIGPMARRVEDLCTVMPLLARSDGIDPTVVDMPFHDPTAVDLRPLRVAWYTNNGVVPATAEVAEVVRSAARALAGATATVAEDRPACLAHAYDLEMKIIGADGGDGFRAFAASLGSTQLHPLTNAWVEKFAAYRTDLAGFADYWHEWDAFRRGIADFLRLYDVILCPAYTQPALPHGASILDENFRGFSHTMAYNVSGLPGAVVRCGTSATGLPIAVQIVAAPWREDLALAVALRLESEFGGWSEPAL
ncbi:MAG: amidase [Candidatus Solibacter sp.]